MDMHEIRTKITEDTDQPQRASGEEGTGTGPRLENGQPIRHLQALTHRHADFSDRDRMSPPKLFGCKRNGHAFKTANLKITKYMENFHESLLEQELTKATKNLMTQ